MRAIRRVEPPTSTDRKVPISLPVGSILMREGSIVAELESSIELAIVVDNLEMIEFKVRGSKDSDKRLRFVWLEQVDEVVEVDEVEEEEKVEEEEREMREKDSRESKETFESIE